ncbi:MAG: hypothetical protein P8X90_37010 [Desulfobacterales bacterium]
MLRAVFSNPKSASGVPKLLPGMFVRLRIPVDVRENARLVPERTLGVDQNGRYLLVVNSQDVADQRPVKVGAGRGRCNCLRCRPIQHAGLVGSRDAQKLHLDPNDLVAAIQQQNHTKCFGSLHPHPEASRHAGLNRYCLITVKIHYPPYLISGRF